MQSAIRLYKDSFSGLSRPVWLLSLMMFINRSGAMVIPFLTVYLTDQLGFSKIQAGYVMSAFGVGSLLGSFLGGYITDRIGFHRVMFSSLFLSGIGFILLTQVETFWNFVISIFLLSTISESFRPATQVAISAYSKPENRLNSISLLRLAINLGFSFGPFIGGLIAYNYSFKGLFLIDGITCMGAAVFFLMTLSPKKAPFDNKEDLNEEEVQDKRRPYKDKMYLAFILMTLLSAVVFLQLFSVFPVYLREEWALTEYEIGLLMALNGLIIVFMEMPLVYSLKEKARPLRIVALGALLIGLSYIVFNLVDFWPILIVSTLLVTTGEILFMPFTNTWAINWAPKRNTGEYMSWFTMVYSLAHIVSPSLGMGIAEHYGYSILWVVLFTFSMISTLGFSRMQKFIPSK